MTQAAYVQLYLKEAGGGLKQETSHLSNSVKSY